MQPTSTILTEPTSDLFSLLELKDHLRFVEAEDQADAVAKAKAATKWAQDYCQSDFLTTTRTMVLDSWGGRCIQLDYGPWQSVTSITYTDTNGDSQTLATSVYKFNSATGVIDLKNSQSWPSLYCETGVITVTFVTGWTKRQDVPPSLKQGVLYLLKGIWDGREELSDATMQTVEAFLNQHSDLRLA